MDRPLWTPSATRRERANLTPFMREASRRSGEVISDYDTLYSWSVTDLESFWQLVWDWVGVVHSEPPTSVLVEPKMPGTEWFKGARLNYAENLLRFDDDQPALIEVSEAGGEARVVTYAELRVLVARFQAFLQSRGVGPGDRVAAWMPNRVETVVAMLAASGLGAIFSSSSPDFGIKGVLDRFGQIAPKVLLCSDGSIYNGKHHSSLDKLSVVVDQLGDGLAAVVVVPVIGARDLGKIEGAVTWEQSMASEADQPTFEQLPFDHPLYIMYSSGTTGVPKCIVHGAGGTLLQHAKEHILHTDLRRTDRLFYFTTCGWMMWNWLVGGLFTGAGVVLWDGSPAYPGPEALWRMAEQEGVTVFGTSPKFLSMCAKEGVEPGKQFHLEKLKAVLSTGAPLSADNFSWVYEAVGEDIQLASISGGTDIISCFMLGSPIDPVYAGEIQKRGLGMAVESWESEGKAVQGQKGELVCIKPFPSMPLGFWNDEGGRRYHQAYFADYSGVWRHGDFVEITPRQGVIVYGRSDATLNPGGVRIGTAEIYRPVEAMPVVLESVVVGLPEDDDVSVVLFVVLAEGIALDAALEAEIRRRIRASASPRHVPKRIFAAPGVPRTISGKKVEIAVTRVLCGERAPNRDALANPDVLDWYAARASTHGVVRA